MANISEKYLNISTSPISFRFIRYLYSYVYSTASLSGTLCRSIYISSDDIGLYWWRFFVGVRGWVSKLETEKLTASWRARVYLKGWWVVLMEVSGEYQWGFVARFVENVNLFSWSCLSVSATNIQNVRIPMIEITEHLSRENNQINYMTLLHYELMFTLISDAK